MKTNIIILVFFINYTRAQGCTNFLKQDVEENSKTNFFVQTQDVEEVRCNDLEEVTGNMYFNNNAKLKKVIMIKLKTIGGSLKFERNSALETLLFCKLETVSNSIILFYPENDGRLNAKTFNNSVGQNLYFCEMNKNLHPQLRDREALCNENPPYVCFPTQSPTISPPTSSPVKAPTVTGATPFPTPFPTPSKNKTNTKSPMQKVQKDMGPTYAVIVLGIFVLLMIGCYVGYYFWKKSNGFINQKIEEDKGKKEKQARVDEYEKKKK